MMLNRSEKLLILMQKTQPAARGVTRLDGARGKK